MKILVRCEVEKLHPTPVTTTFRSEQFEVEPTKIRRHSCGSGKAANRYYYHAYFNAPDGVLDVMGKPLTGETSDNIIRKLNPKWKPPKNGWVKDLWTADSAIKCEVNGVLMGGKAICGKVKVGPPENLCGAEAGTCEHQVTN